MNCAGNQGIESDSLQWNERLFEQFYLLFDFVVEGRKELLQSLGIDAALGVERPLYTLAEKHGLSGPVKYPLEQTRLGVIQTVDCIFFNGVEHLLLNVNQPPLHIPFLFALHYVHHVVEVDVLPLHRSHALHFILALEFKSADPVEDFVDVILNLIRVLRLSYNFQKFLVS